MPGADPPRSMGTPRPEAERRGRGNSGRGLRVRPRLSEPPAQWAALSAGTWGGPCSQPGKM